ncbi:MAG: EAL domain-containing protein [Actinomycetia bacterium]|jgi:diguanylate cyclase (GGDEF)-like protein|nr:EAL domain-containing protein [Actinomycetes bacterium]
MSRRPERPSLARWSLFSVTWHLSVWGGWALVVAAAFLVQPDIGVMPVSFWVIAALVLLGELRPVRTAGSFDPQGVVTSTAFVFAIMYLWGLWPAILLQAGATVVSETAQRKEHWKLFFNVGQYCLSILAAWLVMAAAGLPEGLHGTTPARELVGTDLFWLVPTWLVWYLVNNALVSGVSGDEGVSFRAAFVEDFWYYIFTTAAVCALSPLVVLAAEASAWYIPLLLVPMFAVHKTARISLDEQHKALHDSLTGLPNRKLLLRQLETTVARPGHEPFALALLDLDRFKEVNDTLGHHVGDQLLELVARRITGALRPDDVVARLGGDEFAIFLPGVEHGADAVEIAQRVRGALEEPFHLEDVLLELEASIGITLSPQHGDDVEQLMRGADVAMYLAKELHADLEVYDPTRDHNSTDRLGLLAALRRAIDNDELELHYQPIVDLQGDETPRVEALVRWNHPQRGFIPPDEFIPLAETSGLMHRLTAFVIDTALGQVAEWRRMGLVTEVAVNVSARDLHGSELARTVSEALAKHRLPAALLKLELTERTLTADHSRVLDTLEALEAMDVSLSLDDFGTGFSSMFMLKRLPVSELKVDRSFVTSLTTVEGDLSIVRTIIDLAHSLGMTAVAEGVETKDVWDALRSLGCDTAQGWFVSRPMAAEQATAWLFANVGDGRPLHLVRDAGIA